MDVWIELIAAFHIYTSWPITFALDRVGHIIREINCQQLVSCYFALCSSNKIQQQRLLMWNSVNSTCQLFHLP